MPKKLIASAVAGMTALAVMWTPATQTYAQQADAVTFSEVQQYINNPNRLRIDFIRLLQNMWQQFRSDTLSVPGVNLPRGLSTHLVAEGHNMSDPAFVRMLYGSLLNRQPSQSEVDGWVNRLRDGAMRKDIVMDFLRSQEFRQKHGTGMQPGMPGNRLSNVLVTVMLEQTQGMSNDAFVRKLYMSLLNRTPGQNEVDSWVNSINAGTSRENVIRGFLNSNEFRGNNPQERMRTVLIMELVSQNQGMSNDAFVRDLYSTLLNRTPGQSEVDYWVNLLNSGTSRESVVRGFLLSQEFQR